MIFLNVNKSDALHKKTEEVQTLIDKVVTLEANLNTGNEENRKYEVLSTTIDFLMKYYLLFFI